MAVQAKRFGIEELDVEAVVPGETVILADEAGEEVHGTVFLMSGGGKGPAGKSKAKYKSKQILVPHVGSLMSLAVPCKDFAEGHCPYGEYCSFIQYVHCSLFDSD